MACESGQDLRPSHQQVSFVSHAPKWISAAGNEPVTKVAVQTLRSRLEAVQEYLPLAALSHEESVEYVHQLRVASRRAEAAMEMYRELLPEWRAAWVEEQLGRIRKHSNDARDDDVLVRRLEAVDASAAGKLLQHVRVHRVESQRPILKVYENLTKKNGRFGRRVEKLLSRVRLRGKGRKSKEPTYREWADSHLRPILDAFYTTSESDLADTADLHQFRILGKKLRYAMELLSAAFGSELRRTAYPLLEKLQDELGKVNDHAAAIERIRLMIEKDQGTSRGEYLKEMLKGERAQLQASRQRFNGWWSAKRRDQIREAFEKAMLG